MSDCKCCLGKRFFDYYGNIVACADCSDELTPYAILEIVTKERDELRKRLGNFMSRDWQDIMIETFGSEWAHKDLDRTSIYRLAERIEQLHAKLEKAKEVLRFYADEDSWSVSSCQKCPAILIGEDIEERKDKSSFCGGKVARQALKEIEE